MASAIIAVYATAHRADEVEFRVQLPHLNPRFSAETRDHPQGGLTFAFARLVAKRVVVGDRVLRLAYYSRLYDLGVSHGSAFALVRKHEAHNFKRT